jgi:DNA-binding NarL/FixJ family response regulator
MAVHLACQLRPDVVLMNAIMPKLNGIEATRQITQRAPECKVVILAESSNSQLLSNAFDAGARGYLSRHCSAEELLRGVHDIASGGVYLCSDASSILVDCLVNGGEISPRFRHSSLTPRQLQVLQLIVEGHNIKGIARELSLSPKTVDWHKSQIMKTLGIESIAGLVRYAIVEGITHGDLSPLGVSG